MLHVRDSFGTPILPQFSPAVLLFVKHFEALFCVIDLGCVAAVPLRGGSLGGAGIPPSSGSRDPKGARQSTAAAKAVRPQAAAGDAWSSSHEVTGTPASSSSSSSSFQRTTTSATSPTNPAHPSSTSSSGGGNDFQSTSPPSSLSSHRMVNPQGRCLSVRDSKRCCKWMDC